PSRSDILHLRRVDESICHSAVFASYRFFLHQYDLRPDLHSFPTRRSSDLPRILLLPPPPRGRGPRLFGSVPLPEARALVPPLGRSEEHTSELQSRSDLVCRLLLEKKNPPPPERTLSQSVGWPPRSRPAPSS